MTEEEVLAICKDDRVYKDIAESYRCSGSTVGEIKRRKSYRHFTEDIEIVESKKCFTRLPKKDVLAICQSSLRVTTLADQYNRSPSVIYRIKNGDIYRHITKDIEIIPSPDLRGKNNRKLTDEQVLEIYHSNKTCAALSKEYNLSDSAISLIKRGERYTDLVKDIIKGDKK